MKKYFAVALVAALMAVGLSLAVMHSQAAFQSLTGKVFNDGYAQYFRDVRGYKMVAATAGTATAGLSTTVTGMEAGDVILDVVNTGALADTGEDLTNISEAIYTAGSGVATLTTSTGAPTVGDQLIFLFADVDNTN